MTGGNGNTTSVEVVDDTGNHICFLADLPAARYGQSQFLHTVCGGHTPAVYKNCTKFNAGRNNNER